MRILGVDPGQKSTGFAVVDGHAIDGDYSVVDWGSRPAGQVEISLIAHLIDDLSVDAVAVEDQVRARFASASIPLAFERGRWTAISELRKRPVIRVNPTVWQNLFFPGAQQKLRGRRKKPCPNPVRPEGKRKLKACGECDVCEDNRVISREKREGSEAWKKHYVAEAKRRFAAPDLSGEDAAAACWLAAFVIADAIRNATPASG